MKKKIDKFGKKNVFLLEAKPYKQEIIVVINGQFSDIKTIFKKLGSSRCKENLKHIKQDKTNAYIDQHKANTGSAEMYSSLPHGYALVVSHQNSWIDTVEVVTHECMHLTFAILMNAGLKLTLDSEEAFTYLQGYLVKEILKEMF